MEEQAGAHMQQSSCCRGVLQLCGVWTWMALCVLFPGLRGEMANYSVYYSVYLCTPCGAIVTWGSGTYEDGDRDKVSTISRACCSCKRRRASQLRTADWIMITRSDGGGPEEPKPTPLGARFRSCSRVTVHSSCYG